METARLVCDLGPASVPAQETVRSPHTHWLDLRGSVGLVCAVGDHPHAPCAQIWGGWVLVIVTGYWGWECVDNGTQLEQDFCECVKGTHAFFWSLVVSSLAACFLFLAAGTMTIVSSCTSCNVRKSPAKDNAGVQLNTPSGEGQSEGHIKNIKL